MPIKYTKKSALRNPALVAGAVVASNKINNSEIVKQTASVIPFLIKFAVVGGVGYFVYTSFVKRFRKIEGNSNLQPANISEGEAQTRANSIYAALYGFGNDFNTVSQNLSGLNYNGWVRLYNAFGNRAGANPFSSKTDLVWWLNDQFSQDELMQLRFILPNVF